MKTLRYPTFSLKVDYDYTPGDPGQTSGPPERCYEPEDESLELTQIFYCLPGYQDVDLTALFMSELCEDIITVIEAEVLKLIHIDQERLQEPPDDDEGWGG